MNDQPRRLYCDNAATSFPKPSAVTDAMVRFAAEIGASAGRGAYREAIECQQIIADCRQALNTLFNGENPDHFVFTQNCSDALNMAIRGMLDPGRKIHVISTEIDHNSILRPLNALQSQGLIDNTRVKVDPKTGLVDPADIKAAIRPDTRLICITHASNVTGTLQDLPAIAAVANEVDVPLLVDAAQSAGHVPIDLKATGMHFLAAPGHKALLGPLGTGFLYIRPGMETVLRTTREGGTGSVSETDRQPEFMPDKFEVGSHNAIGIAGLLEGVRWILSKGVESLALHDRELVATFIEGVSEIPIPTMKYFGPQGVINRIGVFSVQMQGYTPHELAAVLESQFGILTRPGIHCAPMIHQLLGTVEAGGATRLSFGPFLCQQDVSYVTDALADIAMSVAAS